MTLAHLRANGKRGRNIIEIMAVWLTCNEAFTTACTLWLWKNKIVKIDEHQTYVRCVQVVVCEWALGVVRGDESRLGDRLEWAIAIEQTVMYNFQVKLKEVGGSCS